MSTTTKTTPTPQQTASMFFGAGALSYAWWRIHDLHGALDVDEPDDWWIDLAAMRDADYGEEEGRRVLTHEVLMVALAEIVENDELNEVIVDECATFLEDPQNADFDADSADQVLQYAVLGEVTFG